jgi:Ca2+-binding RTX toxin-like protein
MALALGAGAQPAFAGTASVDAFHFAHYDASPGQDNNIVVHQEPDVTTIADSGVGATITAGTGCSPVAATVPTVKCQTPQVAMMSFVTGGDGNDRIAGDGIGSFQFSGGDGSDTLIGGVGSDHLFGGAGTDAIEGNDGDDVIVGGGGCSDLLAGTAGNDTIVVGGGSIAFGGDGGDVFVPGPADCAGGNEVFGNSGNDRFDATPQAASPAFDGSIVGPIGWPAATPAIITLDDQFNDGPFGAPRSNIHSDVENLTGGPEDDVFVADTDVNVLNGGDGDDLLDGGAGADTLSGGNGEDLVDYEFRNTPVNVTLDGQRNDGSPGEQDDVGTDIEDIRGGNGNDTLTGGAGPNVIDGGPGADAIAGGAGQDTVDYSQRTAPVTADLTGSPDNDGEATEHDSIAADVEGLIGGSGNDTLTGNASDGLLVGDDGADHLTDTAGGQDLISGGNGADVIAARDDAADTIGCGPDADQVDADVGDKVDTDCEAVTRGIIATSSLEIPDTKFGPHLPPAYTRSTSWSFSFSSTTSPASFRCTLDGVTIGCSPAFTASNLKEGRHTFAVAAVSADGVADPTPASVTFRVDTTRPAITAKLPKARCVPTKGTSIAVGATDASPVAEVRAKLGKKLLIDVLKPSAHPRVTPALLKKYGTRVRLQVHDSAGNVANKSVYIKRCKAR